MSKAPRKPDAAAKKPSTKKPRPKSGGRAPGADQSPEAKSERYVAGTAVGEHSHGAKVAAGKQRMARLHELFDDQTPAMMRVMKEIAEDKAVHASVRLEAADKFLNRLLGKPKEHVEVTDATDGVTANDEVMNLLGNIFEAVGLPPLLEDKSSPTSSDPSGEGSPTS